MMACQIWYFHDMVTIFNIKCQILAKMCAMVKIGCQWLGAYRLPQHVLSFIKGCSLMKIGINFRSLLKELDTECCFTYQLTPPPRNHFYRRMWEPPQMYGKSLHLDSAIQQTSYTPADNHDIASDIKPLWCSAFEDCDMDDMWQTWVVDDGSGYHEQCFWLFTSQQMGHFYNNGINKVVSKCL